MDNTHPSDMTNKKSRNQTKKVPVLEKKSIPIRQKKLEGGSYPCNTNSIKKLGGYIRGLRTLHNLDYVCTMYPNAIKKLGD